MCEIKQLAHMLLFASCCCLMFLVNVDTAVAVARCESELQRISGEFAGVMGHLQPSKSVTKNGLHSAQQVATE